MPTFEAATAVLPFMRPLPAVEDCFGGDVARHGRYFLPLLSVEAAAINPAWTGLLHFVAPKEPHDDAIGARTEQYHSGYVRTDWLAFKRARDCYTFLGDWRFFERDQPDGPEPEIEAHYALVEDSFAETRAAYAQHGFLGREGSARFWFERLGGGTGEGNWITNFPVEYDEADDGHDEADEE